MGDGRERAQRTRRPEASTRRGSRRLETGRAVFFLADGRARPPRTPPRLIPRDELARRRSSSGRSIRRSGRVDSSDVFGVRDLAVHLRNWRDPTRRTISLTVPGRAQRRTSDALAAWMYKPAAAWRDDVASRTHRRGQRRRHRHRHRAGWRRRAIGPEGLHAGGILKAFEQGGSSPMGPSFVQHAFPHVPLFELDELAKQIRLPQREERVDVQRARAENWSAARGGYRSRRGFSVESGSNPCLATLTYLCLSIFSTLPRVLSADQAADHVRVVVLEPKTSGSRIIDISSFFFVSSVASFSNVSSATCSRV